MWRSRSVNISIGERIDTVSREAPIMETENAASPSSHLWLATVEALSALPPQPAGFTDGNIPVRVRLGQTDSTGAGDYKYVHRLPRFSVVKKEGRVPFRS